jgi:hypothetical protein
MMGASIFCGIDPGVTGGLAFFDPRLDLLDVYRMPIHTISRTSGRRSRRLDLPELARIIDAQIGWDRKVVAYIELVGARPGEAVNSSFDFGFGCGALHGLLAAHYVRIETVTPRKWKAELKCPADKDGARFRASQLLPKHAHKWPLVKDDGLAEASLLAVYAARYDQPVAA